MNNVYFSNEGMTSTTANFYANIAKELQNAAAERLNSVKFFKTSVAVIGSNEKQVMEEGNTSVDFIYKDLQTLAEMNAFCAWIREAIKEKEAQQTAVNRCSLETWAADSGIELPVAPEYPRDPKIPTETDVINSWDINKRNKYLRLEAFAATLGKYIHPEGAYSKARKKAHTALNNPITKEGTGRDMILYYTEPSVDIELVDDVFMKLQDQYRGYEQELNQMKAEIKDLVNNLTRDAYDIHAKECDKYTELTRNYQAAWGNLRTKFTTWRTNELERISKLKIVIPSALKNTFTCIKEIADASKK
jgi:Txe/YoeB family toxin of Txe-Axe toxin-antitoxin module